MSGDSHDDGSAGWYKRNFGKPRFSEEKYGYWIFVTGAVLGLVGVLAFLLGTVAGRGTPLFWTARQASAVFTGAGVPLMTLGFVYRLPVSQNVYRLAVAGVVVCLVALVAFLVFYPNRWNVSPASPAPDRSSQVTAVYAVGLLFTVFSATVLPAITPKRGEVVEETDTVETGSRFEVYRDVSADWRWKLRDSEGNSVVDSEAGYPTESEAEKSVEGFRDEVAGATVETRDVLEEYLRSGEDTVVEEGRHQQALGTDSETEEAVEREGHEEPDVRYEIHEEEDGWGWKLTSGEEDAVAVSGDEHDSRSEATNAVESFRLSIEGAEVIDTDPACFVIYRDETGNWCWRLVHDAETLAVSAQGYVERDGVETAVERLRTDEGTEIEFYEDTDGWRWCIVHTNDEVLAESHRTYDETADAEEAAEKATDLLEDAETAEVDGAYFVVYTDDGDMGWTLLSQQGRVLAVSGEVYGTREEAMDAIESVRTHASEAPLVG